MCAAALPWIIPTLLGVGTALLMKPSKPKTPKLAPIEKTINTALSYTHLTLPTIYSV